MTEMPKPRYCQQQAIVESQVHYVDSIAGHRAGRVSKVMTGHVAHWPLQRLVSYDDEQQLKQGLDLSMQMPSLVDQQQRFYNYSASNQR